MRLTDMIQENDPLRAEKKEALFIARDLHYGEKTYERIVSAQTEIQIDNALRTGRNVGSELKFNKIIKNGSQFVAYC